MPIFLHHTASNARGLEAVGVINLAVLVMQVAFFSVSICRLTWYSDNVIL